MEGSSTASESNVFAYQNGQIVLQFDGAGNGDLGYEDLSHRYLWGPAVDMLLADEEIDWSDTYADGEVQWALADHLGTPRDWIDNEAELVDHAVYDSYGNRLDADATNTNFDWTGRWRDPLTGLQYNNARWYNPAIQRWMSEDPIAADVNSYRYVGNSPTIFVDPRGLTGYWAGFFGSLWDDAKRTLEDIGGGVYALATDPDARSAFGKAWYDTRVNPLGQRYYDTARGLGYTDSQIGDIDNAALGKAAALDLIGATSAAEAIENRDISGRPLNPTERAQRGLYAASTFTGLAAQAVSAAAPRPCPTTAPSSNPIQGLPRTGSALKTDPYHAFPNVVDNFATGATRTQLQGGASLFQVEGSLNGVAGRG